VIEIEHEMKDEAKILKSNVIIIKIMYAFFEGLVAFCCSEDSRFFSYLKFEFLNFRVLITIYYNVRFLRYILGILLYIIEKWFSEEDYYFELNLNLFF